MRRETRRRGRHDDTPDAVRKRDRPGVDGAAAAVGDQRGPRRSCPRLTVTRRSAPHDLGGRDLEDRPRGTDDVVGRGRRPAVPGRPRRGVIEHDAADGLKGKHVLITGGSRGIGLACAEEFLREGCNVSLVARDAERLQRACTTLDSSLERVSGFARQLDRSH